jgi:peptidyl-prolyl cis-trans isomerase SurA
MFKKTVLLFMVLGGILQASSQTLFTYGGTVVDAKEFLKAYEKNNAAPATNREKAIRDYLQLFISSKLKVKEAYARGYDSLPHLRAETMNLRAQSMEKYLTDPTIMPRLQNEAFTRSQKDIHVAHIFIAFNVQGAVIDSAAAVSKRELVLQELKKGMDFGQVAQKYSDDPSAAVNKGDIGYITVFTLPYPFENAIYKLAPGKFSSAVASRQGFHIFKNLGERKAAGTVKAQQILLAIPPGGDDAVKQSLARRADSLYKALQAGATFSQLASQFSNDYISAASGGTMPDIKVGEYDPAFERAVFSLKKDGEIAKPVLTAHGWHIIKRVSAKPVVADRLNKANLEELERRIMADSRWRSSGDFIYARIKEKGAYRRLPYDEAAFRALADSILNMQSLRPEGRSIDTSTSLLQIGNTKYSMNNWLTYARTHRFRQDGTGAKAHTEVRDEWEKQVMMDNYRDHLEDYNEEFRQLMTEFRDGNMFFEIMQQEVWNKAQADTAALRNIYNQDPEAYTWKKSADAIVFFFIDPTAVKPVFDAVKKSPSAWRQVVSQYQDRVMADTARYEWSQIPNLGNQVPKAGMITTPAENKLDNSTTFAYIVRVYNQPTPRSFDEAKGMLINDYQVKLEKQWDAELRKKYPVVINQAVLTDILKK